MSNKITRFYTSEDADHPSVALDLTGKTAVIIRRSTGGHQEPSLLLQEQLVSLAMKLRGEETDEHILVYNDLLGGRQEQATNLLGDITSGLISSIIVERPDRLMRHEHTLTTNLLQKQHVIVVVPGKRIYDFSKEEDVKAFQATTQEAHEYIATQITYMEGTRNQKRLAE